MTSYKPDDFYKRVLILFIDMQLFNVLYFFFYLFGYSNINYGFFKGNEKMLLVVVYFSYFLYFDFKKGQTLAMRFFNYHRNTELNYSLRDKLLYELLAPIDLLLSPIYMIQSNFSDKRNRKMLREKYTQVSMKSCN